MEREELLQQVNESIESEGKKLSSLSEESINGEIDDALEEITDDDEKNKTLVAKLAKRLLRMEGNLHSNVSKEVKAYKNAHPVTTNKPKDGDGDGDGNGEKSKEYQELLDRLNKMEQDQKDRNERAAKEAVVSGVKKGLEAKFKTSNIEVNSYILRQTLRDMEVEDADKADVDDLVKKMEKAYFKNLKEAGLGNKETGPRFGQTGAKGESAADRFFKRKAAKEGWKK